MIIAAEITKDLTRLWNINEIAKVIKKQYRPVYAAVKRLISRKILEKNSIGLIMPTLLNTFILEYAERKRVSEINNKDLIILNKRLSSIKSAFYSALLFGSTVNKKGRDIDILIIIPDSGDTETFRLESKKALGSFSSEIDLNIINEESCFEMLNKPNQLNVMNEIMKNHLVLQGFENFYRIIKRWKNDK